MGQLEEGPSFIVPPSTWEDIRNHIVHLGNKFLDPEQQKLGFFRVSTTGWNETFFDTYVKSAVETGTFGQLNYGLNNMTRSVVKPSRSAPGWRESRQPYGRHAPATMKQLYHEFQADWEVPHNKDIESKLNQSDRYAAEAMQSLAVGKRFWYGESYSQCVNESPVSGVQKRGDLSLPVNIMLLYLRFHELFHNFAAANGVSGMWTYVYGGWSGTVLHLEDAFLPSINVNLGPGCKMWYFVPRTHFKQLQDYYYRMGFSPKGTGCAHDFQHKRHAPSVEALLAEDIPVYFLVQRPGDIIFVDGCVFHEVVNWGYGFAQATNILLPSWIHVAEAGLHLRSHCCTEFVNDSTFSVRALTERLRLLFLRLRAIDASREKLEERDTAIGVLTTRKWETVKPKYAADVVGFGEPVLAIDFMDELSGFFRCSPEDIPPDRISPAVECPTDSAPESIVEDSSRPAGSPEVTESASPVPLADFTEEKSVPVLFEKRPDTGCQSASVITIDDYLPRRSKRVGALHAATTQSPKKRCRSRRKVAYLISM